MLTTNTNCPNCGAPIDIHAEKCAYCDTPYYTFLPTRRTTYYANNRPVPTYTELDIDEVRYETKKLKDVIAQTELMSRTISSMCMSINEAREAFANLGRLI